MKKVLAIVLAALLIVAALAGCAAKSETADTTATTDTAAAETTDGKLEVLKVGASSTPHAEILEQVKDTLAAEGYDLQIVVYDDYVLPNQSLADGSLDANYFQHTPYLNSFNAANGTDLVSAAKIHYEPFGLYGNGVDSVDAIASDAYSVPDLCQAWFDASVKAPYRNAVTAIITGATDIDGAMQFVADWQASIG